jgi:hypothetical protein
MGQSSASHYFILAVFFTNIFTLMRGCQITEYLETEHLLCKTTAREYIAVANNGPV